MYEPSDKVTEARPQGEQQVPVRLLPFGQSLRASSRLHRMIDEQIIPAPLGMTSKGRREGRWRRRNLILFLPSIHVEVVGR